MNFISHNMSFVPFVGPLIEMNRCQQNKIDSLRNELFKIKDTHTAYRIFGMEIPKYYMEQHDLHNFKINSTKFITGDVLTLALIIVSIVYPIFSIMPLIIKIGAFVMYSICGSAALISLCFRVKFCLLTQCKHLPRLGQLDTTREL
jgi:hypothetical protein